MAKTSEENGLRFGFVAALAVGTLGIFAGWWLQNVVATVALPLAAMAGYFVLGYIVDRTSLATLQFADSIYYLGFLFTLVALMVSLLDFTEELGEREIPLLVSRFGVALITTIVGLGARIYLVNFRRSVDDSLAQTELALVQSGDVLRRKLDQLSVDMTVQSKLMSESLRGAIELTASEIDSAAKLGKSSVEKAARAVAEAVSASTEKVTTSTQSGAQAIESSLKMFANKLDTTPLPTDLFTQVLGPALTSLAAQVEGYARKLENAGDSHRHMEEAARKLAASVEAVQEPSTRLRAVIDDLEARTPRVQDFGRSLDNVATAVGAVAEEIRGHEKSIRNMREQIAGDASAVESYRSQVQEQLTGSSAALQRVRDELVAAARYVRDQLGDPSQ